MAKKSTMRRGQMIAIAALFTSAVAPYAVSADTVTTTSTEVVNTAAETSTYVEKNVDIVVSTGNETTDAYTKVFFTNVDLEIAADGKKYAVVTLGDKSYAYPTLTDAEGKEIEIISQTGSAETKDWVRTIKLPLDANYQAKFVGGGTRATNFTIDLAHEKFDFEFTSPLDSYFTAWLPNADVVTLKDGKKVAYVTIAGHSYVAEKIYEGTDTSKLATIVGSTGSKETKDLARVVRLELDENNKTAVFIPDSRMDASISFDFTEKDAVADFATATELAKATALKVEYTAVDPAASWQSIAFPSTFTAVKAKAAGDKIHVVYTTSGDVTAVTVKQNGSAIDSKFENGELSFTVDTLEGLAIEADVNSARGAMTFKVNVAKAQADASVEVEDFEVPPTKPSTSIPTTTDVVGKKAKVTFKASSDSLNAYFQKGFFGDVQIVEIDGQSYADLNITGKSIGLEYDYIMADGTKADVVEISGNRATQNGNYEGFSAVVRIPVQVNDKDEFAFTLDTFGGQPGTEATAAYQFTFTGKIQNDVAVNYTDVKNAETKAYVQQLANWGALNLKLDKFNPGSDITRAQFALMIARTLDLKAAGEVKFTDVKNLKDAETKNAIQALFEAGVVNGKTKTTFAPGDKITREQAALMIYRLMTKKLNHTATATADDLNFNDAGDIKNEEAKAAFAELQKAGVMSGVQGFVTPQGNLKRSQMAKILVESLNKTGFDK